MPIYAYRCEGCGFQKDALQKLSDPPLVDCPQCGQPRLAKQVTAAGFALKGTGWYVTDFRDSSKKPGAADKAAGAQPSEPATASAAGASNTAGASAAAPAAATPAPAASAASPSAPSAPSAA